MLIKIIAGTIFGVFFIAPASTLAFDKIDTSMIQEQLANLGSEILKLGFEIVKQSI